MFSAISDGILHNDALKHNGSDLKSETWTEVVRNLKFFDEEDDHIMYLRTRLVLGASEYMAGANGSKQNDKDLFDYTDDEWDYIWSTMLENGSWAVPSIKDDDGNAVKANWAPEILIKYIAHELKCHIIVFDLLLDTVQFISGNHVKDNNVVFDSPILMYSTGGHFQSVFPIDQDFFIKYAEELEVKNSQQGLGMLPVSSNENTQKKNGGEMSERSIESLSNSSDQDKQQKSTLEQKDDKVGGNLTLRETIHCFQFDNFGTEVKVEIFGNKVTCISCLESYARIDMHFKKSRSCTKSIDLSKFWDAHGTYRKEASKVKHRLRQAKSKEKQEAANPTKFKENQRNRKQKSRDKSRKDDPILYKGMQKLQNKKFREKKKAKDISVYCEKLRSQVKKAKLLKKEENESLYKQNLKVQQQKSREKRKAKDSHKYHLKLRSQVSKFRNEQGVRQKKSWGRVQRLISFKKAVKYGAIFVCSSCHQRMFENGVSAITDKFKENVEKKKNGLFKDCVQEELILNIHGKMPGSYLCHTCKNTMLRGRMPCMSVANGLILRPIQDLDKLSEVENNLIAQNILFQKIFLLPKSRMSAVKDRLVNVPIAPSDVLNTIQSIPRTPREAGLIQVKLKRKLKYKNYHRHEYIDPKKIFKTLEYLQKSGHPYYQFFDNKEAYRKRCELEYRKVHHNLASRSSDKIVCVQYVNDDVRMIMDLKTKTYKVSEDSMKNADTEINGPNYDEEEEYVRNDPVRQFQFDHNISTCLTNKFPEMLANDDGKEYEEPDNLSFAPGEGNIPQNILMDEDWDIKAWPSLHPDGKFGLNHKRKLNLSDQKYFVQRIRNKDRRFEENPGYVFAATSYIEKKRLQENANISFSRGKKMKNNEGDAVYTLNDPFTVFENLKNTPKYWQKFKYEMIAKLENLGPFHWFFTLSCADMKWEENFTSLLRELDVEIEYDVIGQNGQSKVRFMKNGVEQELLLREYLEQEVDESLHELIRTNVLNATRNFQHRVDAFIKNIIFGANNPMNVKNLSYKVEFQGRGAGHIHGVLWADMLKIQKGQDSNGPEFKHLAEAFRKLRENEPLEDDECSDLEMYVDKFVTCALNPDKLESMGCSDGAALVRLAEEVQQHRHTRTCNKYDTKCRFHKPTFPLKKTTVFRGENLTENVAQEERKPEILEKVKDLLDDKDAIDKIMRKYDKKGESREEYEANRCKRIDELLEMAGTHYEEYMSEIRHSVRQGYSILLERDIDEGYINAFNPEWLEAWKGNIDLQPTLDYFAVITYVTDYLTKDESGVTAILREVMKRTEKDETKERMQMMINTFLTHRQMGQAEAYYKLIPNLHMKYSTVKTVFIPTDKRELRSRFLQKVEKNEATYDKIVFEVNGREGLFIERPDLIDKYVRRPGPGNVYQEFEEGGTDLEDLVCIHFTKMFETNSRKEKDNEQDFIDEEELNFDENDIKFHYIMRADLNKNQTLLPKFIKLLPKYPGENNLMRKRRFPAAVRFHKKRKDVDTHKFFLSELMLYHPFRDEKLDLHSDNEELCAKLYMQEFDNIQKVKKQVMEHLDNVEEARHMVEEYLNNESKIEEMGEVLDGENVQDLEDCLMEDEELHPDFEHLDPKEVNDPSNETVMMEGQFKSIEIGNLEELRQETMMLDKYQKVVLEVAIRFARGVVKSLKEKNRRPEAPILMVHGGAGSGKSTVIGKLAKWIHYILQRPGDDPDCPYVVISAFTGAAACNVNGHTLHSLFSFNFGNEFMTLSDKAREQKRKMFKNLEILVIDEISLVDSDMLYKIDLRLKEVKQNEKLFGGVALFCFGDLLQIKPVKGRYIFDEPKSEAFKIANVVQPHWNKFKIVNLEENHRQGNDKSYADMLNRIRTGDQTDNDIGQLADRVRPMLHADLKDPDGLWLFGKNKPVDEMNAKRLSRIKSVEFLIKAKTFHNTMKKFTPPVSKTGAICNTPFQAELKLRIGAKVMLTYNINTADGLTNGARGVLIGTIKNGKDEVTKLIVKLDNPNHGKMKQFSTPEITAKYPEGTVIERVSFSFSLSKSKQGSIATAKVEQFPVKLSFAITAHKIQGQTVKKPQKVVVDLSSVFQPAMAYVMLSRVESINQLYILEKFKEEKLYASQVAIDELKKMNKRSVNENTSNWLNSPKVRTRISILNAGSLRTQHLHLLMDETIMKSDIIGLPESWIYDEETTTNLEIEGFVSHQNAIGRGRGITVYYKQSKFRHLQDIKEDRIQLTKLAGKNIELIIVYKAPSGKDSDLARYLGMVINFKKATLVCGDFNLCFIDNAKNKATGYLLENKFKQLIHEATHIGGGHIDHAYLRSEDNLDVRTELYSPYFTAKDHDAILISLKEDKEQGKED